MELKRTVFSKFIILVFMGLAGLLAGLLLGAPASHSFPAVSHSDAYRTGTYSVTNVDVKIASLDFREIHFQVTLPDGSGFDLKKRIDLPANFPTISAAELRSEAEYYRATLQGFAELIYAARPFEYAALGGQSGATVGKGRKLYTLEINQDRLREKGLYQFDPLTQVFQHLSAQPTTGQYSDSRRVTIDRVILTLPSEIAKSQSTNTNEIEIAISPSKEIPSGMLKKVLTFLVDALFVSTKRAWQTHKAGEQKIRNTWDERGLQFGIKIEVITGVGRINIARSLSLNFLVAYNRQTKSLLFGRGFRTEKMLDGANASVGGKAELKHYRLNNKEAFGDSDTSGTRKKLAGQTWYPPMPIPVVSPVLETGRGYQSEGISVSGNFADFGGSFLLNSVNAFEESQRVSRAPAPNFIHWISELIQRGEGFFIQSPETILPASNGRFTISSPITRCEFSFISM